MHTQNHIPNSFSPYSFNGMEKDNEVKGTGNSYTTEFRQLDPRIGRWLSIDPLAHQYSSLSPYAFVSNNPLKYIDFDGRKIINADKKRLEKAKNELNDMEDTRKIFTEKYGSVTNRKDFTGTKDQWKKMKEYNKKYKEQVNTVKDLEISVVKTEELIKEFKDKSPVLFDYIDNLQNEAKENVDFYLGTKDIFNSEDDLSEYLGGSNQIPEFKESGGIVRPSSDEFGLNTITVTVERDKDDRDFFYINFNQNIINHEAGHFAYIVEFTKKYFEYTKQLKIEGKKLNGGHNSDDESGKRAEQYGKIKDLKANEN